MLVTYVFSVVQTFGGVFFRVFVYVLVSKSKTMSICVLVDVHDHVCECGVCSACRFLLFRK